MGNIFSVIENFFILTFKGVTLKSLGTALLSIGPVCLLGIPTRWIVRFIGEKMYDTWKYLSHLNYTTYPINISDSPDLSLKIAKIFHFAIENNCLETGIMRKLFNSGSYYLYPVVCEEKSILIPTDENYYIIKHDLLGGTIYIKPIYLEGTIVRFILCFHKENAKINSTNPYKSCFSKINPEELFNSERVISAENVEQRLLEHEHNE